MGNKINHIRTGGKVPCTTCKKLIYRKGYLLKKYKVFFCSTECNGKYKETLSREKCSGEKNYAWKGDGVSYFVLHKWVRRWKGKAKKCIECGSIKRVQWANKSHEYKRNLDDWIELCQKCHIKFDRKDSWGKATRKYGLYRLVNHK